MVCIEFIGIPGSGKSAVRDALVKKLQVTYGDRCLTNDEAFCSASMHNIDRCYRWLLKLLPWRYALYFSDKLKNRSVMQSNAQNRFIAKYGRSLDAYLISDEFTQTTVSDSMLSIGFFLDTGSIFEVIAEYLDEKRVVFFAEGFVQKSFMFLLPESKKHVNKRLLENYMSAIPCPDFLIHIKADTKTCLSRMKMRPRGLPLRLKKLKEESILDFLKRSDNHLEDVKFYLKKNREVKVIEVDNCLTIDETVSEISRSLNRHFDLR